jgi:hypothetical protein
VRCNFRRGPPPTGAGRNPASECPCRRRLQLPAPQTGPHLRRQGEAGGLTAHALAPLTHLGAVSPPGPRAPLWHLLQVLVDSTDHARCPRCQPHGPCQGTACRAGVWAGQQLGRASFEGPGPTVPHWHRWQRAMHLLAPRLSTVQPHVAATGSYAAAIACCLRQNCGLAPYACALTRPQRQVAMQSHHPILAQCLLEQRKLLCHSIHRLRLRGAIGMPAGQLCHC